MQFFLVGSSRGYENWKRKFRCTVRGITLIDIHIQMPHLVQLFCEHIATIAVFTYHLHFGRLV